MRVVQILSRTGCGACVFTKKAFELARIPYVVMDLDQNPAAATLATRIAEQLGTTQLPIVVCPDGTRWAGLQLDRIADQVRRNAQAA